MTAAFSQVLPVLVGFALGALLRYLGLASQRDGEFLFRLVFYVCAPALAFSSLVETSITRHLLIFPLAAVGMTALALGVGRLVVSKCIIVPTRKTTFLLTCAIVNSAFTIPYAQALYGSEGTARVAAFDIANFVLIYGWLYAVAASGNPQHKGRRMLIGKLAKSMPLYGLAAGLAVNAFDIAMPDFALNLTGGFASSTGFVVTIATGIMFAPQRTDFRLSAKAIAVNLGCGLAIGLAAVGVFNLQGMERTLMLILSVAPVGFNSVTLSSLENLDVSFAAATLSVSLGVSIVAATVISVTLA